MSIGVPVGRLARYLAWMVGALVVADAAVQFARFGLHHGRLHGLVPMFDLDVEQNVPTWYQSMSLLIVAGLLAIAWHSARSRRDPMAWRWAVLSGVAVYLSMDESARIHEMIGAMLQQRLEPGSGMVYAWVLPYAAAVITLFVLYRPWLRALPAEIRLAFLSAGCVYVGGALGMELVEAVIEYAGGLTHLVQSITTGIEETMEMGGVVLAVRALGRYLQLEGTQLSISSTAVQPAVGVIAASAITPARCGPAAS